MNELSNYRYLSCTDIAFPFDLSFISLFTEFSILQQQQYTAERYLNKS